MYYTVYQITNMKNSKTYIGAHKTNNLNDGYMGSGLLIRRAIKKYGIEHFKREFLFIFKSSDEMYAKEKELVNEAYVNSDSTYNLKLGGDGGFDHITSEMKKGKMNRDNSAANKKRLAMCAADPEYKARCQRGLAKSHGKGNGHATKGTTGLKFSDEAKRKMSEAKQGKSTGRCWIHNTDIKQSKSVYKEQLQEWLDAGWSLGRKMKF